jgi:hypothetical protein
MMDSSSHFTAHVLESLAALAPDYQPRALHDLLAKPLKTLSIYRVLELRCAIAAELNSEQPVVAAALDLIDGQIVLREIAGSETWR